MLSIMVCTVDSPLPFKSALAAVSVPIPNYCHRVCVFTHPLKDAQLLCKMKWFNL